MHTTNHTTSKYFPSYFKDLSKKDLSMSFTNTFTKLHGKEVVDRLLTAVPNDAKMKELITIYHNNALLRWHNIEQWLIKNNWRYIYTNNYIGMIILGIQHYCDELSAGWWQVD